MPLLTGLLFNRYTPQSTIVRHIGPLPVFDLVLWTLRRISRRKSLFIAGVAVGVFLTLALSTHLSG